MIEEEIDLPIWGKYLIVLIIGIVIGLVVMNYYQDHMVYRSPREIATHLEEMLFEHKHFEDILHSQLKGMIRMDSTTIGQLKSWYKMYNQSGVSRQLLETQVDVICYDKKWKND